MARNNGLTKVKVYSPHIGIYMHITASVLTCGNCGASARIRGNFKWIGNAYTCKTCFTAYPKSERNATPS